MTTFPIVLFDGVCNLCNRAVSFLIEHDPDAELQFASLQAVRENDLDDSTLFDRDALVRDLSNPRGNMETIIFVEPARELHSPSRVTTQSDAALRIVEYLPRPWRWLRFLKVIPRPIRDAAYALIAKNRYRWFGKRDTCRVPTAEEAGRFIA